MASLMLRKWCQSGTPAEVRQVSMRSIESIRSDTPHVDEAAFLLSSGSSLMPRPVVDAMIAHIRLEERLGGYAAADREATRIKDAYGSIARMLNASPDEIALHNNATASWQMAFYSLTFRPGDRILTTVSEYAANYVAYLQVAHRSGVRIDVVPNNEFGELDVAALRSMMDDRVRLVSVTWVPTNGGLTNPVAEIGEVAREHGALYFIDACQAVGQMPADVEALNCDVLTATGRKFLRGPRGIGFLYIRRALLQDLEPAMIDHFAAPWTSRGAYTLRKDARRFETWEHSYANVLGLGAAVDYALDLGLDQIGERTRCLSDHLRAGLRQRPEVVLRDLGRTPSAIVSFTLNGIAAQDFAAEAKARGVIVGTSNPSSTRLDAEARALPELVRAAPHYFNTEDEVERLIDVCIEIGGQGAKPSPAFSDRIG